MPLKIISGGVGSGKSGYLYKSISETLSKNPDCNAILIVPEQFSFTAEKSLSEEFGGLGINKIEVVTFSRLLKRYLPKLNRVLPCGKAMLLQRAAKTVSKDNAFYLSSSRSGFIDALSDLFSELKRYGVSPDDFDGLEIENEHTAKKLSSINEIYKAYISSFTDNLADSDDDMALFAEIAENSDIFGNTFFYIDDYSDFMPTHYGVIRAFLRRSRGVFVTLCIEEALSDGVFSPVVKTKGKLTSLCERMNVPCETVKLAGDCEYIKAEDIRHLIKNWDEKPKYSGKSENISVFNALDIYSEAEHAASCIISLVRDSGMRFRDIGIICGDMEQYLHILTSVFADFDIPFFTDEKLSVTMHPVAKTVLSLFEIIKDNWSYSAVFDYLRSGYIYTKSDGGITAVSQEDVDILENYVLACGIKGKKAWFSEWTALGGTPFDEVIGDHAGDEFDLEELNALRKGIIAPFERFLENKGRTAAAIAEAVFNFMCDINLYEGIIAECAAFDASGNRNESEQFRQVWNFIIETLDQLVTVTPAGTISREEFRDLFLCGLSECKIAIIPSGIDRVSLGTVSRNSPSRVKALFILGALDGQFPKISGGGNILTDLDRHFISSALNERNKELAPENKSRILLENFKFHKMLTSATEKLFISFPSSDREGNGVNPAHFVSEIIEMFDIKVTENIISAPPIDELLASPQRGFYYMLANIPKHSEKTPDKLWKALNDWYAKNPEYHKKLDLLNAAKAYRKLQPMLSRIKAEMLYGKNKKYSITALEKFEKCPFSYYLERGLCLADQKEQEINASQMGSLMHLAIYEFCKLVEAGAKSLSDIHERWTALTDEECDSLIHTVISKMSEKILKAETDDAGKIKYLLARCEATLKSSVSAVRKSLASGEYAAICYEKDFETQIGDKDGKITLIGKIDRIDVMEDAEKNMLNLRIVDYKSGSKSFSGKSILDKVDMQLVIYAIAAEEMAKSGLLDKSGAKEPQVRAILYSRLADSKNEDISISDSDSFQNSKKTHKMDGLFILDEENDVLSSDALCRMDSEIAAGGESDFLNVLPDKNGNYQKGAHVASRKQFDIMSKYVKKAAVDADRAIKGGNIEIKPYCSGNNTPCSYCSFSDICMFDKKNGKYRMEQEVADIYEYMEKEVAEDAEN